MTTHRYTGTGLRRSNGENVEHGELTEPTDAELRAFGDLFEPVDTPDENAEDGAENDSDDDTSEDTASDEESDDDAEEGHMAPFDPSTRTIEELRDAIEPWDYPVEALEDLRRREREGENRKGAIQYIDLKLEETYDDGTAGDDVPTFGGTGG